MLDSKLWSINKRTKATENADILEGNICRQYEVIFGFFLFYHCAQATKEKALERETYKQTEIKNVNHQTMWEQIKQCLEIENFKIPISRKIKV